MKLETLQRLATHHKERIDFAKEFYGMKGNKTHFSHILNNLLSGGLLGIVSLMEVGLKIDEQETNRRIIDDNRLISNYFR